MLDFLLMAALLAPPSDIVIRHDRPDSLYRALGARFPAVARVGRAGDGTLIARRWVLTAAHVAATINLQRARVIIGGREYLIRRAVPHPEWRELGPHDIGLLELAEDVAGVAPLPLYRGRDEQGRTVILVGHGDTRTGLGGPWQSDGVARGATSLVESIEDARLVLRFRAPPQAGELEGAPGRGDSGGPALIETGIAVFVAGVSSAGFDGANGPGTYGAIDHFTRVSSYLDWIASVTGPIEQGAAAAPPPAYSVGAAFDSARGHVLVFGGYARGGYSGASWSWNGAAWSPLPGEGPSPRNGPAMVYDARRRRVVLVSGDTREHGPFGETWEHDGARWTLVTRDGPPPRGLTALAYDAQRGRVVLFGGVTAAGTTLADTWEWDGARWTQAASEGPPARTLHAMAYDARRGRVVLFGGTAAPRPDAPAFGDTWEWDGSQWTPVAGASPGPRDHVAMGYDAARGGVILRGGAAEVRDQTWLYRDGRWSRLEVPGPGRSFPVLFTDPFSGRVMMYGGFERQPSNELWRLEESGWARVP